MDYIIIEMEYPFTERKSLNLKYKRQYNTFKYGVQTNDLHAVTKL